MLKKPNEYVSDEMQTSRDMKGNNNHFIDTPVREISRKRLVHSLRKEWNMMDDAKKTNEYLFFFTLVFIIRSIAIM